MTVHPRANGPTVGLMVVLTVGLVGCSDDTTVVAGVDIDATCAEFQQATTPIERRVATSDLLERIPDPPSEPPSDGDGEVSVPFLDVMEAMREACPDVVDELLGTADSELLASVDLELDQCGGDRSSGTVTNDGEDTVTVRVEVRYTRDNDVLVDTSTDLVDGLRPGQTGQWETFAPDDFDRCNARVVQVVPE